MDSWLKKLDDNSNKPTTDDVEAAVEADATLTCTSKNCKFNEKNKASHTKKRTYKESFLQYSFTFILENDKHRPLCLICNKVLASECLKAAKLNDFFTPSMILIAISLWRFFIAYCEHRKDKDNHLKMNL